MWDRSAMFCFSLLVIAGALGVTVWLFATAVWSFDEVFLLCVCAVVILSFSLYLRYLMRQAMREAAARKRINVESVAPHGNDTRSPDTKVA